MDGAVDGAIEGAVDGLSRPPTASAVAAPSAAGVPHDPRRGADAPYVGGRPTPQPLRAGQLVAGWQLMVGITWSAVFFAFAATWKASEEIGIGTWWLGPRAQPQPIWIKIFPFALAVLVALCAIYNVRRVSVISLLGALGVALIAVFDMSRSGGLAAIEFAIAAGAVLVSLGSITGTYRALK